MIIVGIIFYIFLWRWAIRQFKAYDFSYNDWLEAQSDDNGRG